MTQPACPHCQQNQKVVKAGFNPGGSQRFRCHNCRKYFTPQPGPRGLDPALHQQALKLYLEATSFRAIGRLLNVHHQSVINWINARAANLPPQVSDTAPPIILKLTNFSLSSVLKKRSLPSGSRSPRNQA